MNKLGFLYVQYKRIMKNCRQDSQQQMDENNFSMIY